MKAARNSQEALAHRPHPPTRQGLLVLGVPSGRLRPAQDSLHVLWQSLAHSARC